MGAPVAVATALANTRTGRRTVAVALLLVTALVVVLLTPVLMVPLAVAGQTATAPEDAMSAAGPAVKGEWGYPLAGEYFTGRGFGYNPVSGCSYCSTNHKGYDMSQECGVDVYAAGPGTVLTAGASGGLGNAVRIDHGNNVVTLYGHMQWGSLRVARGQLITAGTVLGAEGNTGASFGCHLHFELQINEAQTDPEPFMAALGLPLR